MGQTEIVLNFIRQNHGQITVKEAEKAGASKVTLYRLEKANKITKIAPGVFIDPKEFGDELAALQYRYSKGVFYKDTALFLHGMIDRTPEIYEMNFSISNSHAKFIDVPLKTYRQTNKLFRIGTEEVISPGGHKVRTYNIERTLCYILRKRDRSDAETIKQAMNMYVKVNHKNLLRLSKYAKIFKVNDEIQRYMGVLL